MLCVVRDTVDPVQVSSPYESLTTAVRSPAYHYKTYQMTHHELNYVLLSTLIIF